LSEAALSNFTFRAARWLLSSQSLDWHNAQAWLVSFFAEQLRNERFGEANILKILQSILEYARCTKVRSLRFLVIKIKLTYITQEIPSGCYRYLRAILPDWDGMTGREVILALLAYTPISPFQGWQTVHTYVFRILC
jgi:hypothetical protein